MSLYDRSKAEVADLHRCLLEWVRGEVDDNVSAWERINHSWAPGFRLADADGLIEGSKRLLDLQVRFNEAVDDPLKAVWVEGFTGYEVSEDLFQAFYEEWRYTTSGEERGRAWSVLLRDGGEGPHGLVWVHAHRSWLSEAAKPSFRPAEARQPVEVEVPADEGPPDDVPWAHRHDHEALDGPPDDVPWAKREPVGVDAPEAAAAEVPPLTEIRAFFGDPAAQAIVGGAPPPVFDQYEPECWLRELRKGGPEAVLRASLVVLGHLLVPWEEWFSGETAPRGIHEGLTRFLEGDPQGLADAKALVSAAFESSAAVREYEPEGPLPEGFRTYVHSTNAAEAAAKLADAAGGTALALAIKLSPILTALSQPTRLALRAEVLQAFAGQD